jgi:hypothetical protein
MPVHPHDGAKGLEPLENRSKIRKYLVFSNRFQKCVSHWCPEIGRGEGPLTASGGKQIYGARINTRDQGALAGRHRVEDGIKGIIPKIRMDGYGEVKRDRLILTPTTNPVATAGGPACAGGGDRSVL